MFLREEAHNEINRGGKRNSYKVQFFTCDQCKLEFSKRSSKKKYISSPIHFCSKNCTIEATKKGGLIDKLKRKICLERYGVEHHLQNEKIQEKRLVTCEKVFGGRAPLSSEEIKKKFVKTNEQRYGGHFSKTESIKEKRKSTCLEKYGVDSFSKSKEFKDKIDWHSVSRKGFETRILNGTSKVSKIEKAFGEFLKANFHNVDKQVEVNNWSIDFYIPSIKTYVQFDGDYWHGLDMQFEQLLESDKPQFQVIARTKLRDVQRETWFSQNNLRLVRIRESEFKKKMYDQILRTIHGECHGL